jgi:hypothetical protein
LNPLETLGLGLGSAWLSGINLYATVLTLGLLQRYHLVQLPGELDSLGRSWILGLAGILFLIEFLADKVPAIDSVWDAIHTLIRVPAGAVLAVSAFAHFNPGIRLVALLAGGGLALGSHAAKSSTRVAANLSPEPFTNIALSMIEDVMTVGLATFAAFHPVAILPVIVIFTVLAVWFGRKLIRLLRRVFGKASAGPMRHKA